jgi:hypothetical protein
LAPVVLQEKCCAVAALPDVGRIGTICSFWGNLLGDPHAVIGGLRMTDGATPRKRSLPCTSVVPALHAPKPVRQRQFRMRTFSAREAPCSRLDCVQMKTVHPDRSHTA